MWPKLLWHILWGGGYDFNHAHSSQAFNIQTSKPSSNGRGFYPPPPIVQPVPIKAFQQPSKAAAMCMITCAETCPPSPIPPFLLVKNLTDNMWPPKSDIDKRHASLVAKRLTICGLQYLIFPSLEQLQLLHYSKFQMAKAFLWQMQSACIVSLLQLDSQRIVPFICHVNCMTHLLLLTCAPF